MNGGIAHSQAAHSFMVLILSPTLRVSAPNLHVGPPRFALLACDMMASAFVAIKKSTEKYVKTFIQRNQTDYQNSRHV